MEWLSVQQTDDSDGRGSLVSQRPSGSMGQESPWKDRGFTFPRCPKRRAPTTIDVLDASRSDAFDRDPWNVSSM